MKRTPPATPPSVPIIQPKASKTNPHGFTQEDFVAVRDTCMGAGALLQRFQPGGMTALADVVRRDLQGGKGHTLSSLNRRRGEKLVKLFEAAEAYRAACAAYALLMQLHDPSDAPAANDEGAPT